VHCHQITEFCFDASPTLADCCLIPQLFNANRFKISYALLPKILRIEQTCASHAAFDLALPSRQGDAEWR
jgi:glutathione S-transferase